MPGEPESACGCCKQVCASHGYMHAWPAKNCAVSEIFLLVSSIGWVAELSKELKQAKYMTVRFWSEASPC